MKLRSSCAICAITGLEYKITEKTSRLDLKNLAEKKLLTKHSDNKLTKYLFDMSTIIKVLWDEQNVDDIVIPEEHKQIVRERIKKHENIPDCYLAWDDIERKMATRI